MPINLAEKRRGGLDQEKGIKARDNSFEVAILSFWFNLIAFRLLRVGVTTDVEKADDTNTNAADAEEPGMGTANLAYADGLDKPDTGLVDPADPAEVCGADKPGIDIADPV